MLEELVAKLNKGDDLSSAESESAAHALADESIEESVKKDFLLGLAKKGETAEEVASFAGTFRTLARDPGLSDFAHTAIDVCGTGGDKSGSFNISTVVSFILAASGVPVFKHGNRSITSSCGSADMLEAVGIKLDADNDMLRKSMEALNYVFFFAPAFHPAFKAIMPVRKALAEEGQRTIFNVLGPMINPGRPATQLLGVFSKDWVKPLADALHTLGLKRGMVVHSLMNEGGVMDELSCAGENHVCGFGSLRDEVVAPWKPEDFGLSTCSMVDLKGGSLEDNMGILKSLVSGNAVQGLSDSVLWNAGTALWIAGKSSDVKEGIELARDQLCGGGVSAWLDKVRDFYG